MDLPFQFIEAMLKDIFQEPPYFKNSAGTKFWVHEELTKFVNRHRPGLSDLSIPLKGWYIEDDHRYRQFCVTHGDKYVALSQQLETVSFKADLYRYFLEKEE